MSAKNKYAHTTTALIAIGLLSYTILRAQSLSMTHDESGSFLYWMDFPIFECFFGKYRWHDANLHWLYVFLMKPTVAAFGTSEIAIRLPSLLAHIGFLFFSWKILSDWSKNDWAILFCFILINVNPYLLEFFALARGYGLAIFLITASLYYLGKWIRDEKIKSAVSSFGFACLAVLANLTSLNYFAALFIVFSFFSFLHIYNSKNKKNKSLYYPLAIAGIFSTFLLTILFNPIQGLRQHNKLYYGGDSIISTFSTLIGDSLYHVKPFTMYNLEVFGGLFYLLFLTSAVLSIFYFIKNNNQIKYKFHLAISLIPTLIIIGTVVQHLLFGTPYLHHRTALFLLPLIGFSIFLLFDFCLKKRRKILIKSIPAIISISLLLHAFFSFNISRSREWWFDAETKKMFQYVSEKSGGEKIILDCHWLYQPTTEFYKKTLKPKNIEVAFYKKELRKDSGADYYYVRRADLPNLHPDYILEKKFSHSNYLMKRKDF